MDRWMDGEIDRSTDTQIRKNRRNRKNRTLGQIGRLVAWIDGQMDTEIYWKELKEQKKWNKQFDKSQTSRNATYSSQVHTDLLLRFLLIVCMCICYATRSSYARADRLAAMLLAQNLHVRADLPLGRQVVRYIVKKKRIEGRQQMDSQIDRWMKGWMDGCIERWMDGWVDRQIDR